MKPIRETLTFDDVLLVPKASSIFSRYDVSTKTRLTRNTELNIPIVSANMDTVTEARMARFMAEAGGIGIIHRFLSIESQADQVRKVKRAESVIIDDPYTISPDVTVDEASRVMTHRAISGLPVLDTQNRVVGIITKRDVLFTKNKTQLVKDVMTKKVITAPVKTTPKTAQELLFKYRIEKLPLVDAQKRLKGLITFKDMIRHMAPSNASKDKKGRLLVGAAIGVKEETKDRARKLLDAGADVLVLDIAHGHNIRAAKTIAMLKKTFPGVEIVGGNIATAQGAIDLIKAGVDAVKVGVGPGAACITRIVTGVGVPQLSALIDIASHTAKYNIPLIADGGIRMSGDLAKALAAGGHTAMIGSMLAGTDEAPGEYILEDGVGYKLYRGMASRDASEEKLRIDGEQVSNKDSAYRAPEGKSGKVSYRGHANLVIDDLISGLRSSMSYLGAHNIKQFQKNAEFVKITQAGLRESHSHDMKA